MDLDGAAGRDTRSTSAPDAPVGQRMPATDRRGLMRSALGVAATFAGATIATSRSAVAAAAPKVSAQATKVVAALGPSSTAKLTSVTATTGSTTLLAANPGRLGATIFNDSSVSLYVALDTSASQTSFTVKLLPQSYFELPSPVFTGDVTGAWVAPLGAARITELT